MAIYPIVIEITVWPKWWMDQKADAIVWMPHDAKYYGHARPYARFSTTEDLYFFQ